MSHEATGVGDVVRTENEEKRSEECQTEQVRFGSNPAEVEEEEEEEHEEEAKKIIVAPPLVFPESPRRVPEGMKVALITGITGQDGSYLAEFLIEKNYYVYGMIRRSSNMFFGRVSHLIEYPEEMRGHNMELIYGDMSDTRSLMHVLEKTKPSEVYNLAAMSHVQVSFEQPEYTADVDGVGTLRLLEAVRVLFPKKKVKIYQASSSEMYGLAQEVPQTERTPFHPRSPYAVSKVYAYHTIVNYREAYGMFACNGILFNHESPRRGYQFVTRKITNAVARIKHGLQSELHLGCLDARRDWGHAKDYVEAMWMILQHEKPDDFVIATGENHPVREFVELSFKHVGVNISWRGEGVNEEGYDVDSGKVMVRIDEKYMRPSEVENLLGCSDKALEALGWKPKTPFKDMIAEMIDYDLAISKIEKEQKAEISKKRLLDSHFL